MEIEVIIKCLFLGVSCTSLWETCISPLQSWSKGKSFAIGDVLFSFSVCLVAVSCLHIKDEEIYITIEFFPPSVVLFINGLICWFFYRCFLCNITRYFSFPWCYSAVVHKKAQCFDPHWFLLYAISDLIFVCILLNLLASVALYSYDLSSLRPPPICIFMLELVLTGRIWCHSLVRPEPH